MVAARAGGERTAAAFREGVPSDMEDGRDRNLREGQGPKRCAGTAARGDIWPWDGIFSDEARAKRYDASHAVGDALVLPHIETSAIESWGGAIFEFVPHDPWV